VTVPLMSPEEVCDWEKQSTQMKKTNAAKQTVRKFIAYLLNLEDRASRTAPAKAGAHELFIARACRRWL
jgi:hypothetical protein